LTAGERAAPRVPSPLSYTTLFRPRPLIQVASQRVEISGLRDQSAPAQFIKDVLTHKASFPKTLRRSHPGSGATAATAPVGADRRSEEHTSELQSRENRVCRLLLDK